MLVRVASVIAVCARQECVYVVICSRITEWAQAGKDCASGIVKCRAACSPLRVLACCGSDFLRRVLAMCACVPRCGCTECEVAMEKPREQMLQDAVAEKVRSRAAFRRCERVAMAGRVARAHGHGTSSHMRSAVARSGGWMLDAPHRAAAFVFISRSCVRRTADKLSRSHQLTSPKDLL